MDIFNKNIYSLSVKNYLIFVLLCLIFFSSIKLVSYSTREKKWVEPGLFFEYTLVITADPSLKSAMVNHSKSIVLDHLRKAFNVTPEFLLTFSIVNVSRKGIVREVCWGGVDGISLAVRILGVDQDYFNASLELRFRNLRLVCSRDELIRGEISQALKGLKLEDKEGLLVAGPINYSVVKLVRVSRINHEVIDIGTGARLGEWIFWLHPEDLKRNSTAVLLSRYCLGPCIASVLCLDSRETGNRNYVVGGIIIDKSRAISGCDVKCSIRYGTVYYNLTADEKARIVSLAKRLYPMFRLVDYGNGTVGLLNTTLLNVYEMVGDRKPWKLLIMEKRRYSYNSIGYTYIIEYNGGRYETLPVNWVKMVYEKFYGVLLEAKPVEVRTLGLMFHGRLPGLADFLTLGDDKLVVIKVFPLEPKAVALRLTYTNLNLKVGMIGAPGKVDWKRLITYAIIVVATISIFLANLIKVKGRIR
ncbi:MAG: hypothetical protein J7K23_05810 [Thermoproteales archaeon]|nr:hypothetical protein [Thermoproteales archaeon]